MPKQIIEYDRTMRDYVLPLGTVLRMPGGGIVVLVNHNCGASCYNCIFHEDSEEDIQGIPLCEMGEDGNFPTPFCSDDKHWRSFTNFVEGEKLNDFSIVHYKGGMFQLVPVKHNTAKCAMCDVSSICGVTDHLGDGCVIGLDLQVLLRLDLKPSPVGNTLVLTGEDRGRVIRR